MSNKNVTWYKNKISPLSAYLMFWTKAFKKDAFSSRARRTEFFVPYFVHEPINFILLAIGLIPNWFPVKSIALMFSNPLFTIVGFDVTIAKFFLLALIIHAAVVFVPAVSVYFRRMNDSGMGGAFFFLFFEALILSIVFLANGSSNAIMLWFGIGIFVVKFICELALLLLNSDATVNENGAGTKYFYEENE